MSCVPHGTTAGHSHGWCKRLTFLPLSAFLGPIHIAQAPMPAPQQTAAQQSAPSPCHETQQRRCRSAMSG
eukprot:5680796-Pleurochrysis_carterae.AAC.1